MVATLADRLPASLRGARIAPGRRAVVGAVITVAAVVGILGLRLAMASAAARPVAVGAGKGADAAKGSSSAGSAPGSTAARTVSGPSGAASSSGSPSGGARAPGPTSLVVYVSGRVRHPGVLRLAAGSRVQDALRAAGGPLPRSDVTSINLAQPLSDGEQVLVGPAGRGSSVSGGGQGVTSGAGAGAGGTSGAVVDLNSADLGALDSLPGVGPVLAQRIMDWRTAHGRFTSVDELDEVSGIGDKLMAEIRPHVRA
jgi:competence protein ComEA